MDTRPETGPDRRRPGVEEVLAMLVQALAEYADKYLARELNDAAWEGKPVPWMLEISSQGPFSKRFRA